MDGGGGFDGGIEILTPFDMASPSKPAPQPTYRPHQSWLASMVFLPPENQRKSNRVVVYGRVMLWTGFNGLGTSPDCPILERAYPNRSMQVGPKPLGGTMVINAAQ